MILKCLDDSNFNKLGLWSKKKVLCKCDSCDNTWETNYFHVNKKDKHYCRSCANKKTMLGKRKSQKHREKISNSVKKTFTKERKQSLSKRAKELWEEGGYLICPAGWNKNISHSKKTREKISKSMVGVMTKRIQNGYNPPTHTQTGYFYSNKNNITYYYRSSYELKAYKLLEDNKDVIKYSTNFPIIPYFDFEGKSRYYIPDIYVEFKNGIKKVIEVKPESMINYGENPCKIQSAKRYCNENGLEFEVWVEKQLGI